MSRKDRKRSPETRPSWHEAWPALPSSWQHLIALGFLLIVAVGFFAPIHFSDKQLIAGDTVQWLATAQSMVEYEESTGEAALWAGRAFAGMPGYMISPELSVPQIDSVFRSLRQVFWPSSFFFLLLSGTYLLAWFMTRDKPASLLAAVAYGLTTYIPVILVAGHNSKFIALAWAPWMLLAFVYAMERRTLLSALLFAVALACNLRAGHVQITYYVTFAAGIWWIVSGITALRSGQGKSFLVATGWLALGSVLGLMMIAQPYLAQAEFAALSTRGAAAGGGGSGLEWDYAMAWSQGPGELLTLLIADAFGGSNPTYWGNKVFTAGPHYLGSIAIAFAALALWKARDHRVRSLALAAGCMILFALGEYAPWINRPMFDFFPLFAKFRVPETWLSVTALLVAVVAAHGLSWLGREARAKADGWLQRPGFVVPAVLLVFMAGLMVFSDVVMDFESENERALLLQQIQQRVPEATANDPQVAAFMDQQMAQIKEARRDLFMADARRSLIVLGVMLILVVLFTRRSIPYWVMGFAAVLLVTVDLGGVGRRYVSEERLTQSSEVDDEIPLYPFDEYILERRAEAGGDGAFRVLSMEGEPLRTARPSYWYESLGGYSGARVRVYEDFLQQIMRDPRTRALNDTALDLMNVRYLVASRGLPGYDLVLQDDVTGLSVFRNPDPLERATLVDRAEVVPTVEEIWARLRDPDFDPSQRILFLEGEVDLPASWLSPPPDREGGAPADSGQTDGTPGTTTPAEPSGTDSEEPDTLAVAPATGRVTLEHYTGQEMTFSVSTDRDQWLLVSEVYYPEGWKATVDGEETAIHRADYLLRAIRVPAGEHEVTMEFDPASHRIGKWLAAGGTFITYGMILLLLLGSYRRKRSRDA